MRDDVVQLTCDPLALLGNCTLRCVSWVELGLRRLHGGDRSRSCVTVRYRRGIDVQRIDEGLWRWTAPHSDWAPDDEWERHVGCVYWEADDAVVLVDPLVPGDEPDRRRFIEALDRDVARVGRPVAVLLTCEWHARSAEELAARYAGRVYQAFDRESRPAGVEAIEAPAAQEVVYWLSGARAIVPGDTLLGTEAGLSFCPPTWLEERGGLEQLAGDLEPLLELPVERVLTTHGPPVLDDGRGALERAFAAAQPAA